MIASLVNRFEESATLALAAKAKKMIREGRSVINFGVGEPDFNTPEKVIDAAITAAKKGQTKYTPVGGVPELREAVARRITQDYGVGFSSDEVIISCGGKQAIFHFLQAIVEPGDEVVIFSPYWVSFPEMVKMVGGKPIVVKSPSLRPGASDLKKVLTAKTKVVILNSPSNPSGLVYSRSEMEEFAQVLKGHSSWILSDDTYYSLNYRSEPWTSILQVAPDLKSRTCIIGSTSKSYAMTGWRVGWALAPKIVIDAMIKLQSQITSNPCSLSQAAAIEALTASHGSAAEFSAIFKKRRDLIADLLRSIPKTSFLEPQGAFYVFLKVSDAISGSVDQFSQKLLEDHGVCVIPGVAFGEPDYVRLSFALSEAEIQEGVLRLKKALQA